MTREYAKFSVNYHMTHQLLGVIGLSNVLSHCHVSAAKLQGLIKTIWPLLTTIVILLLSVVDHTQRMLTLKFKHGKWLGCKVN